MKIGDRIRIARKINKITIKDLAQYLEISAPTLKKIEDNKLFVNIFIIKKLLDKPELDLKEKDLLEYYYNQNLQKKVIVKTKDERVYIIIPKDMAIALDIEIEKDIYCCYLNNKIILQHKDDENHIFEKKRFLKNQNSFIFYLGQKIKYIQGQVIDLNLDIKKQILTITY